MLGGQEGMGILQEDEENWIKVSSWLKKKSQL